MTAVSEALGALLGRDVAVRARGEGYRVEVDLGSLEEALELAARLRTGSAA
jgi:hypothetical protein